MLKRMMTVAGAAVLALGTTVAFADFADTGKGIAPGGCVPDGTRDGRGGGIMERLDTDGDGQVSREEHAASFDKLDRDGDGYITREEAQAVRDELRTQRRDEMFKRQDADGDGQVSREEFTGPAKMFAKLDANNDGYITEQEAQEFRPKRDGMHRGGRGGKDCGQRGGGPGPGGPGGSY